MPSDAAAKDFIRSYIDWRRRKRGLEFPPAGGVERQERVHDELLAEWMLRGSCYPYPPTALGHVAERLWIGEGRQAYRPFHEQLKVARERLGLQDTLWDIVRDITPPNNNIALNAGVGAGGFGTLHWSQLFVWFRGPNPSHAMDKIAAYNLVGYDEGDPNNDPGETFIVCPTACGEGEEPPPGEETCFTDPIEIFHYFRHPTGLVPIDGLPGVYQVWWQNAHPSETPSGYIGDPDVQDFTIWTRRDCVACGSGALWWWDSTANKPGIYLERPGEAEWGLNGCQNTAISEPEDRADPLSTSRWFATDAGNENFVGMLAAAQAPLDHWGDDSPAGTIHYARDMPDRPTVWDDTVAAIAGGALDDLDLIADYFAFAITDLEGETPETDGAWESALGGPESPTGDIWVMRSGNIAMLRGRAHGGGTITFTEETTPAAFARYGPMIPAGPSVFGNPQASDIRRNGTYPGGGAGAVSIGIEINEDFDIVAARIGVPGGISVDGVWWEVAE